VEADAKNTPQALWRIELFGVLCAEHTQYALTRFPTQKIAVLLAFLAFYRHRRHSRESLTNLLWPDVRPTAGRDSLSQALVWLRRRLEPEGVQRGSVLLADRLRVGLNATMVTTDVADFETCLQTALRTTLPGMRREVLCQAASLYRGNLLSDFHQDWVLNERQRLHTAYVLALRQLVQFYEDDGDMESALLYARQALAADTLEEEVHTDVIRLLAATGQTNAAIRHYYELKNLLARELDVQPSQKIQDMVARIRQNIPPPVLSFAPVPSRSANLPVLLTPFFGREAEIESICRLVQSEGSRLVTLTGMGGVGKTRLGIAICTHFAEAFSLMVAFVPLADVNDASLIPAAIAAALRLTDSSAVSPLEQIRQTLSGQPYLIVLDNAEHLLEATASLVRELLETIPTLTILVTSRQRLGLEGEREVTVASLPLPTPGASQEQIVASVGIQLFVDRARAVRPNFAITAANAETVAQVCLRLEGIPLAIELCAAWAQTLTPAQMLEKLDQRFDLLVSRRRDISERHRTLRAALECSYVQLPAPLQQLFARLSILRGSWCLEAAAVICSSGESNSVALLGGLTELRERSLLVAEEVEDGETGTEMRYRLLETLREFAAEQLIDADRFTRRRAHALYFLARAEQADVRLSATRPDLWLTRLYHEMENLRAALLWSLEENETEIGLRLACALGRYWSLRGPLNEGVQWLRKLLDPPNEATVSLPTPVEAKAWTTLGHLAFLQGNYVEARLAHEQALFQRRNADDRSGILESLYHLGINAYRQDNYTEAQAFLNDSLILALEEEDPAGIARVLLNLGNIAYEQQRWDEARTLFHQSLEIEQACGNRKRTADTLNNLGLVAIANRDFGKATDLFQEALAIYQELTDNYGAAIVLVNLGSTARLREQHQRSWSLLTEGLKLAHTVGNKHIIGHSLLQLGILAPAIGRMTEGVRFLSAAQHLWESIGSIPETTYIAERQMVLQSARATLGETRFEQFWVQGRTTPLGQIITEVLALPGGAETDNG
jgi:predicted ATPase/DNA-binding SARP family transcriptional activator